MWLNGIIIANLVKNQLILLQVLIENTKTKDGLFGHII